MKRQFHHDLVATYGAEGEPQSAEFEMAGDTHTLGDGQW